MKGLYAQNVFNTRKCILPSIKYVNQEPYEGLVCLKLLLARLCPGNPAATILSVGSYYYCRDTDDFRVLSTWMLMYICMT